MARRTKEVGNSRKENQKTEIDEGKKYHWQISGPGCREVSCRNQASSISSNKIRFHSYFRLMGESPILMIECLVDRHDFPSRMRRVAMIIRSRWRLLHTAPTVSCVLPRFHLIHQCTNWLAAWYRSGFATGMMLSAAITTMAGRALVSR
jgi:hypothetical protein